MPIAIRQPDPTQAISTVSLDTPIGPLTAAATDRGVCLLEFAGPRSDFTRQFRTPLVPGRHRYLDQLRAEFFRDRGGRRNSRFCRGRGRCAGRSGLSRCAGRGGLSRCAGRGWRGWFGG